MGVCTQRAARVGCPPSRDVSLMSTNRAQPLLFTVTKSAVSETVEQLGAMAFELWTLRTEIKRRIRFLKKVMKGLPNVAAEADSMSCRREPIESGTIAEAVRAAKSTARERTVSAQAVSSLRGSSRQTRAKLARACRIALLEAGGTASPEDIRQRIVRRGSFLFGDPATAEEEIIRTLIAMTVSGEVRASEDNSQFLPSMIAPGPATERAWES
jgi:hypothetical protein